MSKAAQRLRAHPRRFDEPTGTYQPDKWFPETLQEWLKKPDKQVVRAELWEVIERYHAGFRSTLLHELREAMWYRRLWRFLTKRRSWQRPKPQVVAP